jgi:NAD(P)-dependent dehydrogenase (short-subunit alcohol dehydrogenase family)
MPKATKAARAKSKDVAVVTGGASGIGQAAALRLAAAGHPVAVIDNNASLIDTAVAAVAAKGVTAKGYVCDVTDAAALDATARRIERELGPVGVLVPAAGLIPNAESLMTMDMAQHERVWRVNYDGVVHTCRAFARAMIERRRGAIVTIGSINSHAALPLPAYGPGKAAIMHLTKILAVDLGHYGIRVNSVGPTYTMTPPLKAKIDSGQRDPQAIKKVHALDMWVEPGHVADAIAFLASDQAAAITGVLLPVDAGYLAAVTYRTYAGGVPWEN